MVDNFRKQFQNSYVIFLLLCRKYSSNEDISNSSLEENPNSSINCRNTVSLDAVSCIFY